MSFEMAAPATDETAYPSKCEPTDHKFRQKPQEQDMR